MTQRPFASIIIPTFLREEHLVLCIRSAMNQQHNPLEILVIDQTPHHTETTQTYLNSVNEKIRRIIPPPPPSAVTARNIGLREAKGGILIFIDDDTEFKPDFVEQHVAAQMQGADVVQGRVVEAKGGIAASPPWIHWHCKVSGSNTCDKPGKTNAITGCNFSISRRAATIVGEFDTAFTGSLLREDSDYGLRCWKAGLQVRFEPKAELYHHQAVTGGVDALSNKPVRMLEPSVLRNELYFVKKHFPLPVQWLYRLRLARRLTKRLKHAGISGQPIDTLLKTASQEADRLFKK